MTAPLLYTILFSKVPTRTKIIIAYTYKYTYTYMYVGWYI